MNKISSFSLRKQDPVFFTGLIALLVSTTLFFLTSIVRSELISGLEGVWLAPSVITVIYFLLLTASGRIRKDRNAVMPLLVFVILLLLAAYSLNRHLEMFEISTTRFCIALTMIGCTGIATSLFARVPAWIRYTMIVAVCFGIGVAGIISFRPAHPLSLKEYKNCLQNATLKSNDFRDGEKGYWHAPTPCPSNCG